MDSGIGPSESLAVVDHGGIAFDLIRHLGLALGVWRVSSADELGTVPAGTMVMLAVYSGGELDRGHALYRGVPTVVFGVGTGPREGSRALQLGAVGYVHDDLSLTAIRDGIFDSLLRAHRRWRRS